MLDTRTHTKTSAPASPDRTALRVLLTTDCVGGVWTFVLELARALDAAGADVLLATMGRELDSSQRAEVVRLRNCTIYESSFRLEWMEDPWADVDAAGRWLLALEAEWKPDVVHCNTLAHAALGWQSPVILTVHSCVYSWFQAVKRKPPPGPQWHEYFRRVSLALREAETVVIPTESMQSALDLYPAKPAHVEVIPNGRSPDAFATARTKRRQLLAVGRLWDEGKNAALLARIAPRLPCPCLLAGELPSGATDPDSLDLLGPLPAPQIAECMAHTAIFVHPALYEPFGLAPLEAGLAHCALVLSDIPSLREIWGEDTALFVDPRDDDGWVEAVEWLAASPGRWQEYGERAYRRARTFSREQMGAAYLGLYARTAVPKSSAFVHS